MDTANDPIPPDPAPVEGDGPDPELDDGMLEVHTNWAADDPDEFDALELGGES